MSIDFFKLENDVLYGVFSDGSVTAPIVSFVAIDGEYYRLQPNAKDSKKKWFEVTHPGKSGMGGIWHNHPNGGKLTDTAPVHAVTTEGEVTIEIAPKPDADTNLTLGSMVQNFIRDVSAGLGVPPPRGAAQTTETPPSCHRPILDSSSPPPGCLPN